MVGLLAKAAGVPPPPPHQRTIFSMNASSDSGYYATKEKRGA
jgi:hypothetical protein